MSALLQLHQRSRCYQCRGLRFSSAADVRRYLAGERARVLALLHSAGDMSEDELRHEVRTFLNLVGQMVGLCSDCSSTATARALEPRRRRRRAA